MTKEELLKQVWESCTFDEILQYGLEKMKITGSDLIDCASIYSEHEFSDDEIASVIQDTDIHIIMEALEQKYDIKDIIDELDKDEILKCFNSDEVFDYFEWDLDSIKEDEHRNGYEEGYEEAIKNSQKPEINPIKDGTIDDKWRYLCDLFDLTHYDDIGLYNKLNKLIKSLNKSTYKDKNDKQWLAINIE